MKIRHTNFEFYDLVYFPLGWRIFVLLWIRSAMFIFFVKNSISLLVMLLIYFSFPHSLSEFSVSQKCKLDFACSRRCAWTQVCVSNMGEQRSVRPLLLLLLLLLFLNRMSQLWAFPFSPSLDLDVTPRTTVFSKGEEANGLFHIFQR